MAKSQSMILKELTEIDLLELADKYQSASDILRNEYGRGSLR